MISETSQKVSLPLCHNISCLKSKQSEKVFWKREIDHQYKFYLATLRAQQDAKFLIEEHADLMRQTEIAEDTNVKLRKEIRLLETELYVMYQRNAHDSAVIDGLQEADYVIQKTGELESDISHKIEIAEVEGNQENVLSDILKEEISLLKKKDVEDREIIASFKPLEKQLENTLNEERLKTHQQGMKFKREFEELQQEFEKRNSDLDTIVKEKSSAILWAVETFSLIYGNETESGQQPLTESEAQSEGSSNATDSFDVSSVQEYIIDNGDPGKEFQKMIEEYREFIALKELLDSKNLVNIRVVLNCLKQFSESGQNLAQEYLSVFEVVAEIAFINEYLQRLDLMRQKKDVRVNEDSIDKAQRLDQLKLIYTSLLCEKMFLINSFKYFTLTLPEDFEAHCVNLRKTEDLFVLSVQSDHLNEQNES